MSRPPWTLRCLELAADRFLILLGMQHLEFDGSGLAVFLGELQEAYAAAETAYRRFEDASREAQQQERDAAQRAREQMAQARGTALAYAEMPYARASWEDAEAKATGAAIGSEPGSNPGARVGSARAVPAR